MTTEIDARMIKGLSSYPPQAIVKAPLGLRPAGWGPDDCDAPVISMLAGTMLNHATVWGPNGIISASSQFDSTLGPEKMWDGDVNTRWCSLNTATAETLTLSLHTPRSFDAIYLGAAASTGNSILAFDLYVDDVLHTQVSGLLWSSITEIKTIPLSAPVSQGSVVRMEIPPGAGRYGASTFKLRFTDVPIGHVVVPTGLQVAYADRGQVRLSDELSATATIDLSAQPDGTYDIASNWNADGSFSALSFSAVRPEIGISRVTAGADLYNPATVTMLDSTDAPIRRVYLGSVVKSGGSITAVHCYAMGRSCKLPVNNGNSLVVGVEYRNSAPFVIDRFNFTVRNHIYHNGSFREAIPPIYISTFRGAINAVEGNDVKSKITGTDAYVVSGMAVANVSTGRWMLVIDRGY